MAPTGVWGMSTVFGAIKMDSVIHRMLCRKGTCEKAARPVREPSFRVRRTLVGAWLMATTLALSSAYIHNTLTSLLMRWIVIMLC